jgi:hypothetical protein
VEAVPVSVFGDATGNIARLLHAGYGASGRAPTTPLNAAGQVPAADTLLLYPFVWYGGPTLTSLYCRVTTAGTASNVKIGMWRNDYATGRPTGVPVAADNAGAATTGTGLVFASILYAPPPGIYWLGSVHEGSVLPSFQTVSPGHFTSAMLFPAPISFSVLQGGSNLGVHGLSTPLSYSADIASADLTAAVFSVEAGTTGRIPHICLEWSTPPE